MLVGKLPPVEFTVFKEFFWRLKKILSAQTLSQYLVSADVISFQDDEEICAAKTSFERSTILLQRLVGPLESGNTFGFYQLLQVMEEHGINATKDLAAEMRSRLSSLCVIRGPTHLQSSTVTYRGSSLSQRTSTMSSVSPALKPREPSGVTDHSDGVKIADLKGNYQFC